MSFSPSLMRWSTAEPRGANPYVDGLDLYEAFKGNPITKRDPTGRNVTIVDSTGATTTAGDLSAAEFILLLASIHSAGNTIDELTIRGHANSDHIELSPNPNLTVLNFSVVGAKVEVHVVDAMQDSDITDLLNKVLGAGAAVALNGCHTAEDPSDGFFRSWLIGARSSGDSLAGEMSKALPGTAVTGIRKWAMNIKFSHTGVLGDKRTFVDGKEVDETLGDPNDEAVPMPQT